MLTNTIAKLDLKSDKFQMRNHQGGVKWFGRYFLVTPIGREIPPRNYTMVLCMTADNIELRNTLISLFESKLKKDNSKQLMKKFPEYSDFLPLIIKKYEGGKLSSFMVDEEHPNYLVEGPMVMLTKKYYIIIFFQYFNN